MVKQPQYQDVRRAASRIGSPRTAVRTPSGTTFSGLPSRAPFVRARARPALTRSAIRARSNSAMAARICICSLPAGVVASMPSCRLTNATPNAWSSSSRGDEVLQAAPQPIEPPADDEGRRSAVVGK